MEPQMRGLLSSIKLTIGLLILLAALSVIGTLIPQNASPEQYVHLYSPRTYKLLRDLGLLDMYHSWWFLAALGFLALNIAVCSLQRLPVLRKIRDKRWRLSRLGVYIAHFSILLILTGGLMSGIGGFRGFMRIGEGEASDKVVVGGEGVRRLPFEVRCDDFEVTFWPDGTPKEYVSRLSFLEGGKVVLEGVEVRVNHPVEFRGLTFYQASYGSKGKERVRLSIKASGEDREVLLRPGDFISLPGGGRLGLMKYAPDVHGMGEGALVVFFFPEEEPKGVWLLLHKEGDRSWQGKGITVALEGVQRRYWTGLEVARDPGVWIVWVGSASLMVGLVMAFWFRGGPKDGGKG